MLIVVVLVGICTDSSHVSLSICFSSFFRANSLCLVSALHSTTMKFEYQKCAGRVYLQKIIESVSVPMKVFEKVEVNTETEAIFSCSNCIYSEIYQIMSIEYS